ncbi:MBL fold metallo-hydrolase [Wenxinia saemankumensis]|uniref:Hydroxyacylglutathione hydrolase n=1 Tax=Wenxinia saemankumensis TaxID=1447782 RepID=A0A1M6HXY6_9RHOB|nr:MBL fold metallo-hydrolase [Wenxinia saemankumensis]SHJ26974.1 hydroxyacylglutathione hydrolase [Wenxinia saemankumensis]
MPGDPAAPGRAEEVAPGILRLLAPNPSPLTGPGTNTWLVGDGDLAVIDPGPADPRHLEAILAAARGRRVRAVLVTHAHRDHSALARPLAERTGAPVLAFGDARAGRSHAMAALAATGGLGGGEGVDRDFAPDECLADGTTVSGADWALRALHTPGHMGNHLCFLSGRAAFTGDLVMGWASTLISPPDGDLGAFLASCARLAATGARLFLPGHGAPVEDGPARIADLIAHRRAREAQIRAALAEAPGTAAALAARIYADTPPALLPAATRNVLAHLLALHEAGAARPAGPLAIDVLWRAT